MTVNLEDQLIDKVRALPPDKQQEALRLLDTLAGEPGSESQGTGDHRRPIWEIVEEVNAGLPADTWEKVPTDGSINLDQYLSERLSTHCWSNAPSKSRREIFVVLPQALLKVPTIS